MVERFCKSLEEVIFNRLKIILNLRKILQETDKGYFLEADVQYTEKLHDLHDDLRFLPKRMKIKKLERLATNLHDKTEYAIHIRHLGQVLLNHGLIFKKFHRVIKFNQNVWLKPCIDMNTELRKQKAKK